MGYSCQVRASAVLVPEQSDLGSPGFLFAYSVRMSLLPEGCIVHGMKFESCQLYWRHWIIRENEVVKNEVDAEAVIGKVHFIYKSLELLVVLNVIGTGCSFAFLVIALLTIMYCMTRFLESLL